MSASEEHASSARRLLAGAFQGVLSTHSTGHEGYPFGSLVPYALARDGRPLMLLSHLSQHTKNLEADPRCGLIVIEGGSGDVQQCSRLSAIGEAKPAEGSADDERYFHHFPRTRVYHDELGFRVFRFEPLRFHWNAGFATARWFDPGRILRANPFDPATEQSLLDRLNNDHADTLRDYLRRVVGRDPGVDVSLAGIDGEGMDLRAGDRLYRVPFPRAIDTADAARAILVEMAAQGV